MKRNSMLTKIIAVLLCALMVAAWLPKTSAAANDFESAPDRHLGTDAANAMSLTIGTNAERFPDDPLTNTYYAYTPAEDGTLTLTAAEGTTLTVDGDAYTDAVAVTAGTKYIIVATSAAKNHSFTAALETGCAHATTTTTNTATCTEAGVETVVCDECGETISETAVEALGHDYTGENGACKVCGEYQVDETLKFYRASAAEPYASMMLGAEIKISVNIATYLFNYDEYYIEFKMDYNGGTITKALPSSDSTEYYGNFQYAVPAPLLTETIFATVYGVKDDVVYSGETISFTVRDSIVYRLDKAYGKYTTNATAKKQFDMYIHMLKYGAEAQTRFNVNTGKLATSGVNKDYLDLLKTDSPAYNTPKFATNNSLYLYNFRLKLQEKINFYGNFLFMKGFTKVEDYTVVIEHTKADGSTVSYNITSENGGLIWDGSYYLTFDFNEIAPAQMRDQLTITLYKNGVAVTETYSATGDMATASTNATLRDAVLNFADCAKAYFG